MLRMMQSGQKTDNTGTRDRQKCRWLASNAIILTKKASFRPKRAAMAAYGGHGCDFGRKEQGEEGKKWKSSVYSE
ncbi:MAG: hypothetical protein GY755_15510 [Chloroflexi bacterium]|nr:hypothetical protein [Chloroflexota bacterium]